MQVGGWSVEATRPTQPAVVVVSLVPVPGRVRLRRSAGIAMQPAARVPTVPSVLWDHDHYVRYKQSATTDLKRWKEDLRREIEGMCCIGASQSGGA